MSNDILRDLWQGNSTSIKDIDMEEVKSQSRSLNKKIVIRNSMEWGAALVVAIAFAYFAVNAKTTFLMVTCIELVLAAIFVSVILFKYGRCKKISMSLSTKEHIELYRNNLDRQISLLSKARYWYVAPIFLGLFMFHGERFYNSYVKNEGSIANSLFHIAVVIAFGLFVIYLNEVKAVRDLRKKLEALPELDEN